VRSNKAPIKSLIIKALRNLIGMLFGGESLNSVWADLMEAVRPFPKLNLPTTLQGRKALRPYEAITFLQEIALMNCR
jgi:hypothetical protein